MRTGLTDTLHNVVTHLNSVDQVVDGDYVLIVYYALIIAFFIFDMAFRHHIYKMAKNKTISVDDKLLRFYQFYTKHGFIIVNVILYILCIIFIIVNEGFEFDFLITTTLSFILYTGLMKILLLLFIDEDSYKNGLFIRSLNVICYMILGNYFVFFLPFIRTPNLLVAYFGLVIGLAFCFYIMIQAIFNPEILRRSSENEKGKYAEAFGILKGMLAVLVCILLIEFMMVYSCFVTDRGFYQTGEGRILNTWDMLYYLIISFTTIGYGDIYPVRFDGMFYSEFTAITIGITSMFVSACFISAVISTANSIAQSHKKNKSGDSEDDSLSKLLERSEKRRKT